jgi:hypothetical protein
MIPEESGKNRGMGGWATVQHSDTSDVAFAGGTWARERVSCLITVLTGLFWAAFFFVVSNLAGAQRSFPWMLLGVVCGLILCELARFAVVHSGWPLLSTPAVQRVAETVGILPPASWRRRFRGPHP